LGFGLAETLKASNTITVRNSLSFLMVHKSSPNGRRFMSYGYWKLDRSAETEISADSTFQHKSGIRQNFTMTSPENLNTKLSINELSFLLVTDTVDSDAQFGSYVILKSGERAQNFLYRLVIQANGQVLGHKKRETCWGVNMDSKGHLLSFPMPTHTHVSDTHSHGYGHFGTATCGVSSLLEIGFTDGLKLLARLQTAARL
jgi:hypothetical protein